jgi:hypothetical protein
MARFIPLLKGDQFDAPSRLEAEFAAMQRYGAKLLRCMSVPDLEQEQEEMRVRQQRRRPPV